jgi:hypothetical protein
MLEPRRRTSRKQLHIWLADEDHEFLARHAASRDETVGLVVRRLVRQLKRRIKESSSPASPEGRPADET